VNVAMQYRAQCDTCPREEVSGNASREFVIRTDFPSHILRLPVSGYLLSGASTIEEGSFFRGGGVLIAVSERCHIRVQ